LLFWGWRWLSPAPQSWSWGRCGLPIADRLVFLGAGTTRPRTNSRGPS
jgi:hypothetical protein